MINFPLPILGFAAWSGTGKTTLLTQLIPLLNDKGLQVGLVKHTHHTFSIDHKGKDSYRLREAGASQVVIASEQCIASISDRKSEAEPSLQEALAVINTESLDLILVEGFKEEAIPKIELYRKSLGKPYLYPEDSMIFALAEDSDMSTQQSIPHLDLNQPEEIAIFIQQWLK